MHQLEKIRETLYTLSHQALQHRKLDEGSKDKLRLAIKKLDASPPPNILLYGVSQTGKSTLFATLIRGEQFVPIGVGTATTVVPTELWPVMNEGEERAIIWWKSPREVLESMLGILLPHISIKPEAKDAAAQDETDISPERIALEVVNVSDPRHRQHLLGALSEAESQFRRLLDLNEPAQHGEALVIARALLLYYEFYEREYREDGTAVRANEIHGWLRRPADWMQRDEFSPGRPFPYTFDDVKCFFVKRAQLFARCLQGLSSVCVVDAPGYGITDYDNAVLEEEARRADSIILILGSSGSELTQHQLDQISILSRNVSKNPFVLWNAKGIPVGRAEAILRGDLSTIRRVLGLNLSSERALVADFLLALRATQLSRFNELSERSLQSLAEEASHNHFPSRSAELRSEYVRRYLETTLSNSHGTFTFEGYDAQSSGGYEGAVRASNLNANLESIIDLVRRTHEAILLSDCAHDIIDVLRQFLFTHPTKAHYDDMVERVDLLDKAIPTFQSEVPKHEKKLLALVRERKKDIKSDLADTLWEKSHFNNVKSTIKANIDKTYSRIYVPHILRRDLTELFKARFQLWLQQIKKGESVRFRNYLLSEYHKAWRTLRDGLKPVCEEAGGSLTLPDWPDPDFDFSAFQTELMGSVETTLLSQFPNYILKGAVESAENLKVEIVKGGRNLANTGRRLAGWLGFNVKVKKYPPPQRFDRAAAKQEVNGQVESFYARKNSIPDDVMWEKIACGALENGIVKALARNSGMYSQLLNQRLNEMKAMVHDSPAPLSTDERESLNNIIEDLGSSVVLAKPFAGRGTS